MYKSSAYCNFSIKSCLDFLSGHLNSNSEFHKLPGNSPIARRYFEHCTSVWDISVLLAFVVLLIMRLTAYTILLPLVASFFNTVMLFISFQMM